MQDSLKDQLLKAEFIEKQQPIALKKLSQKKRKINPQKIKPKNLELKAKKAEKIKLQKQLERKIIKAQIKVIIENAMIKDHKGEQVYSYIFGKHIRQLYLNAECHQGVSNKELAITRLNGSTLLIPATIAEEVLKLNPDWAVILANDVPTADITDEQYSEYKVPDNLHW